jgi:opacity protein-like surface antigen
MQKFIVSLTCSATLLSISTLTYSANGPYVSGNLGLSMPRDADVKDSTMPATATFEDDEGIAFGAAVGYVLANTRIEGEYAYQKNDLDKIKIPGVITTDVEGDITSSSFLLNGYYDFRNASSFTPFLSAGIGVSKVELSAITVPGFGRVTSSIDDTVFAYQLSAGVAYAVNETVAVEVKYRYFVNSDLESDTREFTSRSHNIYAGIRFLF